MVDNKMSLETRLTKIDKTPETAVQEDVSILTRSTRESKAKVYTLEAVKNVTRHYNGTIEVLYEKVSNNHAEIVEMKRNLDEAMKAIQIAGHQSSSTEEVVRSNLEPTPKMKKKNNNNKRTKKNQQQKKTKE